MQIGRPRALAIVQVLGHAEQPMTAAQLGRAISVSERTVKTEISAARAVAGECGATLQSGKGRGFWLDVVDRARFRESLEELDVRASVGGMAGRGKRPRTRELLGRLLLADDYRRLDDLAEQLFVSRSALRPDLVAGRAILGGFRLQLESRPHSGLRVTGSEFGRRLCITHLFDAAFHRIAPTLAEGFSPIDHEEANGLRQDLLRVLRSSAVRVSDIRTQRMAQYLALAAARARDGHPVQREPAWTKLIGGCAQLDVAREVMAAASERTQIVFDDAEAEALAVLLLMFTDVEGKPAHVARYGALGVRALEAAARVHEELAESFGIELFRDAGTQCILAAGLIPLLARLDVGLGSAMMSIGWNLEGIASPTALAVAWRAASAISPSSRLATDAVNDLAGRVTVAIDAVRHDFAPRRIALCTGRGLDGAAHLRSEILDYYPRERFFSLIDTFELYELRGVETDRYDAVVFDGAPVSYRYEWPAVFVERPLTPSRVARFHQVVIEPGFGFDRLIGELGLDQVTVLRELSIKSVKALAAMIAFRLGQDQQEMAAVEAAVVPTFDSAVAHGTWTIVLPTIAGRPNQLEVYQLASTIQQDGFEVNTVMVAMMNFAGNDKALRLFDELTVELVHARGAIDKVAASGSLIPLTAAVAARAR